VIVDAGGAAALEGAVFHGCVGEGVKVGVESVGWETTVLKLMEGVYARWKGNS